MYIVGEGLCALPFFMSLQSCVARHISNRMYIECEPHIENPDRDLYRCRFQRQIIIYRKTKRLTYSGVKISRVILFILYKFSIFFVKVLD